MSFFQSPTLDVVVAFVSCAQFVVSAFVSGFLWMLIYDVGDGLSFQWTCAIASIALMHTFSIFMSGVGISGAILKNPVYIARFAVAMNCLVLQHTCIGFFCFFLFSGRFSTVPCSPSSAICVALTEMSWMTMLALVVIPVILQSYATYFVTLYSRQLDAESHKPYLPLAQTEPSSLVYTETESAAPSVHTLYPWHPARLARTI